jgi:autotransporter-associated beta strand protein
MNRFWRSLIGGIGFGLAVNASLAGGFTWNGTGTNSAISTGGNWNGGVAPTNGSDLNFGSSSNNTPDFTSNFTSGNITTLSSGTYYNFTSSTASTLTLGGNVTTNGSTVLIGVTLALASGSHTINASDGDVYFFSDVSGSGSLVKTGGASLYVDHTGSANTFSGTIDLQSGNLIVHGDNVLGTGDILMNGGSLLEADYYDDGRAFTFANNLKLSTDSTFGEYYNRGSLTFTGNATAMSGVTNANVHVYGSGLLTLKNLGQTSAGTSFIFDGNGTTRLTGSSTYTGSTTVSDGTLIFAAGALPTGAISSTGSSYVGTEDTSAVATFLTRLAAGGATGLVGFDSPNSAAPQSFSSAIDLSSLNGSVRLGTSTAATFSGTLTPQGSTYQFGGRGTLTVSSGLTGTRGVTVSDGLQLYLSGTNTYSAGTTASGGAVIFSANAALPSAGSLTAETDGYIGNTTGSGLSEATFLSKFNKAGTSGVVGFDANTSAGTRTLTANLDLTGFGAGTFLGTTSHLILDSSLTLTPQGSEYRFTGFRDGQLTVNATLSGSRSVVIGLDPNDIASTPSPGLTFSPSVTLGAANTYTGGTTLQSGRLLLANSSALGSGALTVGNSGTNVGLGTTSALTIANHIDFGSGNYDFALGAGFNMTLTGTLISNYGELDVANTTLTVSGNNSGLHSDFNLTGSIVNFTSDNAAGVGGLFLNTLVSTYSQAYFTSAAPVIGHLYGDSNSTLHLDMGAGNKLTVTQDGYDDTFYGLVTGNGGLIKDGNQQLTLDHANTYTGGTTIIRGVLQPNTNTALGTGNVTLNGGTLYLPSGVTLGNTLAFSGSGGTVSGSGGFSSSVSIGSTANLSPGFYNTGEGGSSTVGKLTFSSTMNWAANGTYTIKVISAAGAPGTGMDTISVSGALSFTATLGSPFVLNLVSLNSSGRFGNVSDFSSSSGYSWLIASAAGGVTGFNAANFNINLSNFSNDLGTGSFSVTNVANNIFLNFSPVPEPSTWALLASGTAAVAFFARRRRRA